MAPGVELWRSTSPPGERRILPDGCLDLIFDGEQVQVAGPDTAARLQRTQTRTTYTGVRLHAGLGPAALDVPAEELRDATVSLDDVWGPRRAARFTEAVAADPAAVLGDWAVRTQADPFGFRLRALLAAGHSVAGAADRLGYSARQLQRRTRETFGYGPQHLARVLRLLQAVEVADRGLPWAQVATLAGYADQSHLARDVRALAGTTPTGLRRERGVRSVQDAD